MVHLDPPHSGRVKKIDPVNLHDSGVKEPTDVEKVVSELMRYCTSDETYEIVPNTGQRLVETGYGIAAYSPPPRSAEDAPWVSIYRGQPEPGQDEPRYAPSYMFASDFNWYLDEYNRRHPQ